MATGNGDKSASTAGAEQPPIILPPGFANAEQAKPPVIDDETWKTQSPKTRALIEEILIKTASKQLDDDDIKLLQNMADKLTKK